MLVEVPLTVCLGPPSKWRCQFKSSHYFGCCIIFYLYARRNAFSQARASPVMINSTTAAVTAAASMTAGGNIVTYGFFNFYIVRTTRYASSGLSFLPPLRVHCRVGLRNLKYCETLAVMRMLSIFAAIATHVFLCCCVGSGKAPLCVFTAVFLRS